MGAGSQQEQGREEKRGKAHLHEIHSDGLIELLLQLDVVLLGVRYTRPQRLKLMRTCTQNNGSGASKSTERGTDDRPTSLLALVWMALVCISSRSLAAQDDGESSE